MLTVLLFRKMNFLHKSSKEVIGKNFRYKNKEKNSIGRIISCMTDFEFKLLCQNIEYIKGKVTNVVQ